MPDLLDRFKGNNRVAIGGDGTVESANVHFKEFSKKGSDHSLDSFRTLLDGTTNWPAVMEALEAVGYRGYLTFEYFHPFLHYPEALVYQASDALDRITGRM